MRDRDLAALQVMVEARGGFGHREHLELAWTYLAWYDIETAKRAMAAGIRHVAGLHGAPDRYHDTITVSWVHLVAVHRHGSDARSFDEFIAENPGLLERGLLERHYSPELLAGDDARARWTEPDRAFLPALA
ncbi:MAG TPA: hypothetical protein VGH24_07350 [Solirubrobacteraceae bacterium]|jgi:hypothetical protein